MNDIQEEAANSAYEDADDDDFEFKSTVLIANLDEIELVAEQEKETSHHYFIQIKSQLSRISFLKGARRTCANGWWQEVSLVRRQ